MGKMVERTDKYAPEKLGTSETTITEKVAYNSVATRGEDGMSGVEPSRQIPGLSCGGLR
jgi:hypothetical protein